MRGGVQVIPLGTTVPLVTLAFGAFPTSLGTFFAFLKTIAFDSLFGAVHYILSLWVLYVLILSIPRINTIYFLTWEGKLQSLLLLDYQEPKVLWWKSQTPWSTHQHGCLPLFVLSLFSYLFLLSVAFIC